MTHVSCLQERAAPARTGSRGLAWTDQQVTIALQALSATSPDGDPIISTVHVAKRAGKSGLPVHVQVAAGLLPKGPQPQLGPQQLVDAQFAAIDMMHVRPQNP